MFIKQSGKKINGVVFNQDVIESLLNPEIIVENPTNSFNIDSNGLVLDWDSKNNSGGVLYDNSSYGNNGVINNGVDFGADDNGSYFTGYASGEYININNSSNWRTNIPHGNSDRTLIAVVKSPSNSNTDNQFHIFHYGSSYNNGEAFGITLYSNYSDSVGGYPAVFGINWWGYIDYAPVSILNNTTYIIIVRFSSTNQLCDIHINGVKYQQTYRTNINTKIDNIPRAGDRIWGGEPYKDGKIYRIMMYNKYISDEYVTNLDNWIGSNYNITGYSGGGESISLGNIPISGLNVYFDTRYGFENSILKDYSGNKNHAFLSGSLTYNETPPYLTGFNGVSSMVIPTFSNWETLIPTGSSDRTIAVAFKTPTTFNKNYHHIFHYGGGKSATKGCSFGPAITTFTSFPTICIHTWNSYIYANTQLNTNTNYVIIIRYSETLVNKIDFYILGNFYNGVASEPGLYPLNTLHDMGPVIGRRVFNGEGLDDGYFYSLLIYDRILTTLEVSSLYNEIKTNFNI